MSSTLQDLFERHSKPMSELTRWRDLLACMLLERAEQRHVNGILQDQPGRYLVLTVKLVRLEDCMAHSMVTCVCRCLLHSDTDTDMPMGNRVLNPLMGKEHGAIDSIVVIFLLLLRAILISLPERGGSARQGNSTRMFQPRRPTQVPS